MSCAKSFWQLVSVLRQTKTAWAFPSCSLSHHFSHSWFCALCDWLPILFRRIFLLSGGCFSLLPFSFLSKTNSFLLAKISCLFFFCCSLRRGCKKARKSLVLIPSSARICWLIEVGGEIEIKCFAVALQQSSLIEIYGVHNY